ncbi:MAG: pyrimidine reductase family protein [Actinomycetota bacterium]|nr:pyrimidine reductase family protein [Actinomycetota bacterium]
MLRLWPPSAALDVLDDTALVAHYAWPDGLAAPYVRANMVSSLDGAVAVDGKTSGLGSAADLRVFELLRELAEVILVGAGTVRVENYNGARRPTRGRDTHPPIAVVSGSAALDPDSLLFTDTFVPPLVLTLKSASEKCRDRVREAGGEIVLLERLTPQAIIAELDRRGLHRVLCEGGPTLLGNFHEADAVDELCLTVAPLITGGGAGRITSGTGRDCPRRMELVGAVAADDELLLRYRRLRGPAEQPSQHSL